MSKHRILRMLFVYLLFVALVVLFLVVSGRWKYLFDGNYDLVEDGCIGGVLLSLCAIGLTVKRLYQGLKGLIISDEGILFLYMKKNKNVFVPWHHVEAVTESQVRNKKHISLELRDLDRLGEETPNVLVSKKDFAKIRKLTTNTFDCEHQELKTLLKSRCHHYWWKKRRSL